MGVKNFFNRTVTVRRLKTITGNKTGMRATATVDCSVQELDRQARVEMEVAVDGRAWRAYFEENDDIQEGDQITDDEGVVYKVLEVTKFDVGINRHLSTLLIEYNA